MFKTSNPTTIDKNPIFCNAALKEASFNLKIEIGNIHYKNIFIWEFSLFTIFWRFWHNRNIRFVKSMLLLFCLDPVTETTEKLAEPPAPDIASWNYIVSVIGARFLSLLLRSSASIVDTHDTQLFWKSKQFSEKWWKVIFFLKEKNSFWTTT